MRKEFFLFFHCVRDTYAGNKKEERKEQIGRIATIPLSVFQHPVHVKSVAVIIDHDHGDDRYPPEKIKG